VASADGRNLYTHSESRKAIGVFALNGASIAQLAGPSGCLGTDAAGNRADGCGVVDTIDTQSFGLAISPDGASVYLGGYQLAILARDAALGTLTGLAKPSGCILNAERNGCSAARYLDAPFRIAISADSRFVYAFAYDADAIVGFSRTPPDAPDGGGAGDGGDPAAAVPRAARVAWIRKARAVRVRFLATAGVAYRLTAVKGARTRSARCTTRVRMKALRGTCAIRGLAPGRWAFALTPALNGVSGDPTRKTLRIRARTARR
jgi:DNA-binding beta-propeller fold protein YncE